jgi:hypothetical protein
MAGRDGDGAEVRAVDAAVVDARLGLRCPVHNQDGVFDGHRLALECDGAFERRASVLGAAEHHHVPGPEATQERAGLEQQDSASAGNRRLHAFGTDGHRLKDPQAGGEQAGSQNCRRRGFSAPSVPPELSASGFGRSCPVTC